MSHAGHIGENHAEAVIERHRYAKPISICGFHAFADEETIVHKVVVCQNNAFGKPCGA
jgi:hypothetical protein